MGKYRLSLFLIILTAVLVALAGCTAGGDSAQAGLTVEEHALQGMPQIEPLTFAPQDGSQEEILQAHAAERALSFPDQFTYVDGNPAFISTLEGKSLTATQFFINSATDSYVAVTQDGSEIYRISTGPASPVPSLRGLWVYESHWALETVLINLEGDDVITPFALGQVTVDGILQNEASGYADAFGLQTIGGRLFYFFKKDGKIGFSFDGRETLLDYEEVLHYRCCSESALNPVQAQNMVAFFARAGDAWYYVEIGTFNE